MDEEAARKIAERRLKKRAAEYLDDISVAFQESLPGNHSPAETILLAYLMTISDGYNSVDYQPNGWKSRRKSGWGTTLGYLEQLGPILVPFVFECRHDSYARQLVILLDEREPGVRTAEKQHREAALLSLGAKLLVLTPGEIFADPDRCAERIEAALFELSTNVLSDAGLIRGRDG